MGICEKEGVWVKGSGGHWIGGSEYFRIWIQWVS